MTFWVLSTISYFNPKQTLTSILLKAGLKNFAKFTGKHLYWILFLIRKMIWKTPALECLFNKVACSTLSKKRLQDKCFPVNFAKRLKTTFLQKTFGRLLVFDAKSI